MPTECFASIAASRAADCHKLRHRFSRTRMAYAEHRPDTPDLRIVVRTCASAVRRYSRQNYFSIQSAHFATLPLPHGMIGTEEVEFFGDPSMILSL